MTNLVIHPQQGSDLAHFGGLYDWQRAAQSWALEIQSERTRQAYLNAWRDFLAFLGDVSPDQVTQDDVIAYKSQLKTTPSPMTGKPISQSTINQRLSALSSFFGFAQGRGLRADNPADGVKRESVAPYGRATWLDVEAGEDLAFLGVVDDSTDQGKRDKAIFLLFFTKALRVNELASLTVKALRRQGNRGFLTYRRKGGDVEEVDIPNVTLAAIDAYLETRDGLTDDSPLWVATDKGKAAAARLGRYDDGEEKPLTARAIRYLVDGYGNKSLGEGHKIHPHSLRHTAAAIAEAQGLSFSETSRLLMHKSKATTLIYLQSIGQNDKKIAAAMGERFT